MRTSWRIVTAVFAVFSAVPMGVRAGDADRIPPEIPKDQRGNLERFLRGHDKPDRYVPRDAKVIGATPGGSEVNVEVPANTPIKQYMAQITSHRPVPDQPVVTRADVYYYRPNPQKGKPGITVKYTVDLTNGQQVGQTEVLLNHHTPMAREELADALALAKSKSQQVRDLYAGREDKDVRWEYLQQVIGKKHDSYEPGDRVVRFVFMANAKGDGERPAPLRVIVNLTKEFVAVDDR